MEITGRIQKIRTLSILNRRFADRENVFISIIPNTKGGGSNTFSYNFSKWLKKNSTRYHQVHNIGKADTAVIIADKVDIRTLEMAKNNGCFIIHRLDEHVEPDEDAYRQRKHAYIRDLNSLADVTVYQSNFVFENMHPFLGSPERYEIIHNGADPEEFYPADTPGERIGHITWGVGEKKRLDILYKTIRENPGEKFLLIGNHMRSKYDFAGMENVQYAGPVKRGGLLPLLHRMKFLFFPSENDPCPNTVIESILAGLPVCYNPLGGTRELVKDRGLPFASFKIMLSEYANLREKCIPADDLHFNTAAQRYLSLGAPFPSRHDN